MRIKKVWAVYFSGTGTTEKTVRRIAAGMAQALDAELAVYDFTTPAARQRELQFNAEELAVLGVPVYAGRVPNVLLPYLTKQLHGGGALAVPVVLFGNRNFDDGLIELRNILTEDGFMPVAGGAFVGEHAFSRTLGAGRPNGDDLAEMDAFARRAAEKVTALTAAPAEPVAVWGETPIRPYYTPRQHPEGEAENGYGQVRRLRAVRGAVPHGKHRPGGCVAGDGDLHQVLRLREGLSCGSEIFRRRGVSVSQERAGGGLCEPGGQ